MSATAFILGLSAGVGVGNLMCSHFIGGKPWFDATCIGGLAFLINIVFCLILVKLGFFKT